MTKTLLHSGIVVSKARQVFCKMTGLGFVIKPAVIVFGAALGTSVFIAALHGQSGTFGPHGEIKVSCMDCHTTEGFTPIRTDPEFNHGATLFPLQGMHAKVECRKCHAGLVFTDVGMQCSNCHADIHRRQFGSNCEQCHSPRGWQAVKQTMKDHANRFPLMGAHAAVECDACHKSAAVGLYRGLITDCASCHITDFRNAKSINHLTARFPAACQMCHGTDGWMRAFDHNRRTGFALTGAHGSVPCQECHSGGQYAALPTTCESCHMVQYSATRFPNHASVRFSQECSSCHSTTAWIPASFNHSETRYPLAGAHVSVRCNSCHIGGRFTGTPTDCFSCHLSAFSSAANPNHVAAGFSRDCSLCHSTSTWGGAVFVHASFPIFSGKHKNKWTGCGDCHINSSTFGVFSCITCHEHEKAKMDPKHRNVMGYVFNSTICYACHLTGQAN